MERALKLCFAALYAIHMVNIIDAEQICKVPRGNAGTCMKITNCPPLRNLYKKKHKTINENKFIRQSICGYPDADPIKVCCPSQSEWSNFRPDPIIVPTSIDNKIPSLNIQPNLLSVINVPQVTEKNTVPNENESTRDNEDYTDLCGIDSSSGNKITGGQATAIDQYPWLALLEYANNFLACGGSLISPRYVLTAGHCILSRNGKPLFVRLGEYNTTSYPTDLVESDGGGFEEITVTRIAIRRTYVHPRYRRERILHDIGLIEMQHPAEFGDFIKLICIPQEDYMVQFNISTFFYVAGWGSDNVWSGTDVKMDTTVPYKTHSQCPLLNQDIGIVPALQICAGGEGGRDSCRGDSGGPLMYETEDHIYYAIGIVSYGDPQCGKEGSPAVYTYVYSYWQWIRSVLNGNPNNN